MSTVLAVLALTGCLTALVQLLTVFIETAAGDLAGPMTPAAFLRAQRDRPDAELGSRRRPVTHFD